MKLKTLILAAILLVAFIAPAFSQEMPAPGTTIDKNNYKKYAHLFPEEFAPAFMDGFGGYIKPLAIKVNESKPNPVPKMYLDMSKKNKGKTGLDAQGYVTGYDHVGLPFPDLNRNEKDFLIKWMWNFEYRYQQDDQYQHDNSFEKRKGEKVRIAETEISFIYFINRMINTPKPTMGTPANLAHAMIFQFLTPESMKNTMTMSYRYMDPKKPDDTYLYLPAMRRTLRAEASQRSTPLLGSTQALDDFNGFDGRIPNFGYELIGEKKALVLSSSNTDLNYMKKFSSDYVPFQQDNWEIRDVYVIDIKPKDPKYPQSKKRIYMDKENCSQIYYTVVWDRAGKLWKMWFTEWKRYPLPDGTFGQAYNGNFGIDFQFGLANYIAGDMKNNNNGFVFNDFTPASLLKRAR